MTSYLERHNGSLRINIGDEQRALPLVIAGPILRRTEADSVTVWIALQQSRVVTLRILDSGQSPVMEGSRRTSRLGRHLHVVAVEATADANVLRPGEVYQYDLRFRGPESDQVLSDVLNSGDYTTELTYGSYTRPTFVLPPDNIERVRVVHASCRKPHGPGHDAFPAVDRMIESTHDDPIGRPQQLFLTGDQIYADDVADKLLTMLTAAADTLLGRQEVFEISSGDDTATRTLREIPPRTRQEFVNAQCRFTTEEGKSHLLGLGEYYAMYLFAWSDVLWPLRSTLITSVAPYRSSTAGTEEHNLVSFLENLRNEGVRRALANVPTYMIFDDHEVTDDWYLHRRWCTNVLSSPAGKRVLKNALIAYAVFQAWGNDPEQFEGADSPGGILLDEITQIPGRDGHISGDEIDVNDALLRIPSVDQGRLNWDSNPQFEWHYNLEFGAHELIVLDTRTHRGFPDGPIDPPQLIKPSAFGVQFPGSPDVDVTFVVSPCPPIVPPLVEAAQRSAITSAGPQRGPQEHDAEHWHFQHGALAQLFSRIAQRREQTKAVVLSGDVHYGYSVRTLHYGYYDPGESPTVPVTRATIANFTASASKNQSELTNYLHDIGYHPVADARLTPHGLNISLLVDGNEAPPSVWSLGVLNPIPSVTSPFTAATVESGVEDRGSGSIETRNDPFSVVWRLADSNRINSIMRNIYSSHGRGWISWINSSDFLIDTETPSAAGSPTERSPVSVPPPWENRTGALGRYLAQAIEEEVDEYNDQTETQERNPQTQSRHRVVISGGNGKDIVGRNNVGEVWFNRVDGDLIAMHELWWRMVDRFSDASPYLHPFPLTKHAASLDQGYVGPVTERFRTGLPSGVE